MIGPDKKFVRTLRARVDGIIRASPVLHRVQRARPSVWTQTFHLVQLRWIVPFAALALGRFGEGSGRVLDLCVLWTLGQTLFRADQLQAMQTDPRRLALFFYLPIPNGAVFDHVQSRVCRQAIWLALDWLGFGLGLALSQGTGWLLAIATAAAQGVTALGVAVWLNHIRPNWPFRAGFALCWMFFIAVMQLASHPHAYQVYVQPFLDGMRWLTPGGWLRQAQVAAATGHGWGWLVIVAQGGLAAAMIMPLFRRLRQRFRMEPAFEYSEGEDLGAEARVIADDPRLPSVESELAPELTPENRPADATLIAGHLGAINAAPPGAFLATRGWIESCLIRLLSQRQRTLIDFFRPVSFWGWSRGWIIALVLLLMARVCQLAHATIGMVAGITTVGLGLFALPIFGGIWPGFDASPGDRWLVGRRSMLPVGFWEAARLVLIVNALRMVAAFPLVILGVHESYTVVALRWADTVGYSLNVLLLTLTVQPIWIILLFSRTTSDATRWWVAVPMAFGFLGAVVVVMGVAIGMFVPLRYEIWPSLVAGAVALGYCFGCLGVYGLAYRWGWFDSIAPPPASKN